VILTKFLGLSSPMSKIKSVWKTKQLECLVDMLLEEIA